MVRAPQHGIVAQLRRNGVLSIASLVLFSGLFVPTIRTLASSGVTRATSFIAANDYDATRSLRSVKGVDDIERRLEVARSYYLQGLGSIEKKDTVQATRFFESAVQELNVMASTPDIDKNPSFTGLAQQVIEDFESYIQSIDNLGESSPTYMLRDKIFKDLEAKRAASKNILTPESRFPSAPTGYITTIPLTQNEYVSRCVDYLTADKGKKFFSRWIERTGKWFPLLKQIAREENMPEEIIHLAMVESALNPRAVSRASAVGMWQFMQSTGELYKLRVTPWKDDRRSPERATRAAMRHLRDLYNDLGDWHLALAAYNCGPNGVKRAISNSGLTKPNFWDIRPFLPKETRDYVPMFIATTLITMQHEAYGFRRSDLNFEAPYEVDTMLVQEPIALSVLASCARISMDSLKSLNTDLLSYSTPPNEPHVLKLPAGLRDVVSTNLAAIAPEDRLPWVLHEVQRGETIASIAARYEAPIRVIESSNNTARRSKVRPGSVIRIPREALHTFRPAEAPELYADAEAVDTSGTMNAPKEETSAPAKQASANLITLPALTALPPATQPVEIAVPEVRVTHTCKAGETLYGIASAYGVRLSDLRSWNELSANESSVRIGQQLVLVNPSQQPIAASSAPTVRAESPTALKAANAPERAEKTRSIAVRQKPTGKGVIHRVSRGETLAQIADDYGTTIQDIRKANRISARRALQAGQKLKIPVEGSSVASNNADDEQSKPSGKWTRYKVRRGDNISVIAGEFGVREQQLKQWNPRLQRNGLLRGQVLRINVPVAMKGSASAPSRTVNAVPKYYTAKRGDTMAKIAKKYGISLRTLIAKNNDQTLVRFGQRVRLL